MKPLPILAVVLLLAVFAFAQDDASPSTIPRVDLQKLTVRHLFDVTYTTTKEQKIQSAKVISVSPRTEQAGVSFGDELVMINGEAIKDLEVAEFQARLQAHEATTYTFRRKPYRLGRSSLRELTLLPVSKAEADALGKTSPSKDASPDEQIESTIHQMFDVKVVTKRRKIQAVMVSAVTEKVEQAGLHVGDELMMINDEALTGLRPSEFQARIQRQGVMTCTFRKKDPASGQFLTWKLTLRPAAKAPGETPAQK